jgi:ssDNA thymidine ADP-ribosyltransferase, DarT
VVPKRPKIYHITHVDNLPQMVDDVLWSDADRIRRRLNCQVVGMSEIKRRRLEELEVNCHPGTRVGEYVPFYLCPRSIMLFLLYKGNHVDLSYTGGQRPIVHLQADLHRVIDWADSEERRWAFSSGNAGARYTQFFNNAEELDKLDWNAIAATKWKDPLVRERKQAEFLLEESFPWELVDRIGAIDHDIAESVAAILDGAAHLPKVVVVPDWYY